MNPLALLLTALLGINASYELGRNIRDQKEHKRRKAFERAGRERVRHVAHLLAREGGPGSRVRVGVDDLGDLTLTVLRWPAGRTIPTTFMGYPVLEPADQTTTYQRGKR